MKYAFRISVFAIALVAGLFLVNAQEKGMTKKAAKKTEAVKPAHTMTGYLVDKMCGSGMAKKDAKTAMEKAKNHAVSCALEDNCSASGFGLVMDGKFYKFDAKGDNTKAKDNVLVEVAGTHSGEILKVASISPGKEEAKKTEMKKSG